MAKQPNPTTTSSLRSFEELRDYYNEKFPVLTKARAALVAFHELPADKQDDAILHQLEADLNDVVSQVCAVRKDLQLHLAPFALHVALIEKIESEIKTMVWPKGKYGNINELSVTQANMRTLIPELLEAKLKDNGLDPAKFKVTVFDLDNTVLKNFISDDVKQITGQQQRISFAK